MSEITVKQTKKAIAIIAEYIQRASKNDSAEATVAAISDRRVPSHGPNTIPPTRTSTLPGSRQTVARINSAM